MATHHRATSSLAGRRSMSVRRTDLRFALLRPPRHGLVLGDLDRWRDGHALEGVKPAPEALLAADLIRTRARASADPRHQLRHAITLPPSPNGGKCGDEGRFHRSKPRRLVPTGEPQNECQTDVAGQKRTHSASVCPRWPTWQRQNELASRSLGGSRAHTNGEKGTPFYRCAAAGAKLCKAEQQVAPSRTSDNPPPGWLCGRL